MFYSLGYDKAVTPKDKTRLYNIYVSGFYFGAKYQVMRK